jgi:hypothetical protein
VQILHIPDDDLTRVDVTPEHLQKWAKSRVILTDSQRAELGSILKGTTAQKQPEQTNPRWGFNLRWGLLLSDKSGREVDTVFFDGSGTIGLINGEVVRFSRDLSTPLHQLTHLVR